MSAKVILAVLAILCGVAALAGFPSDVEVTKTLAVGLVLAAIAVIVP